MWMLHNITDEFQNQYHITNKFADYRGGIDIELFKSDYFDQIAMISHKDSTQNVIRNEVLTQKYNFDSEVLAYIPYCISNHCKKVLLCGTLNVEIAYLFALHGVAVDMVVNDREALNALSGFFSHFKDIQNNDLINIQENFLKLNNTDYDVLIHLGDIKLHELQALKKLTNKQFILIFRLHNLYLELNHAFTTLSFAKDFGHILMPFYTPTLTPNFYAFLSNRYHPLADLQLQKSDMLDNLEFYNSNLHVSMFRLPSFINIALQNCVKN